MPPNTQPIPLPTDHGDSARHYLESHGLTSITPVSHASDFPMAMEDPFRFYLTRRLGLAPALSYSTALNRGTWFHTAAQATYAHDDSPSNFISKALDLRLRELTATCDLFSISPQVRTEIIKREVHDQETAWAWFTAACQTKIGSTTLPQYLAKFRILSTELKLSSPWLHPTSRKRLDRTITIDLLLHDPASGAIFILDYKTCSEKPSERLAKCPLEHQTWHYLSVTQAAIDDTSLLRRFNLPPNTRLGGMIHVAIQKPTIKFGENDRPYEIIHHILKSGPRKGQTDVRYNYTGEPTLDRYLARCTEWYTRTGRYADTDPNEEPPVNYSVIGASIMDASTTSVYNDRMELLRQLSTCPANPSNFLANPNGIYNFASHSLSVYAPFYLHAPQDWPSLVASNRFIQAHRDSPSNPETEP